MAPKTFRSLALRPDFVFDIETIPDVELCRTVYGEDGMSDEEAIGATLAALGREPGSILPEAFQKPIVIAGCLLDYRQGLIRPHLFIEGRPKSPNEEALLLNFWQAIEPGGPSQPLRRLVSFNGKAFDMRVVEIRSLQYESLSSPVYFQPTEKFDTYRHRYSDDAHLDLVEYLPNYGSKAGYSLRTVASLIGLPGKDMMDGSQVYPAWKEGRIMEIAAYCLEDVIQTALIKIRVDRLRGILELEEMNERLTWFLEQMESFLVEQAIPQEPAFEHTLKELRERYRPAMLKNTPAAKTSSSPPQASTGETRQTGFLFDT